MLRRLQKKVRHIILDYSSKKLIKNLAAKRISLGKNYFLHDTAILDTDTKGVIVIGDYTELLQGVSLMTYGGSIRIGDNCNINPYTVIYGHGSGTIIGNNVLIAAHCVIIPANHIFSTPEIPIRMQGLDSNGIVIEDDVWLGAGVKVLNGVRIGRGSIIAAGAVVTKSVQPYSIMAGVPAIKIRSRK